jgi:hypothetical protein
MVGLHGRGISPVARPIPTCKATQTQTKSGQTSMPRVGFELTIAVFERAKTFHALDRAATVMVDENFQSSNSYFLSMTNVMVTQTRLDHMWNSRL